MNLIQSNRPKEKREKAEKPNTKVKMIVMDKKKDEHQIHHLGVSLMPKKFAIIQQLVISVWRFKIPEKF